MSGLVLVSETAALAVRGVRLKALSIPIIKVWFVIHVLR